MMEQGAAPPVMLVVLYGEDAGEPALECDDGLFVDAGNQGVRVVEHQIEGNDAQAESAGKYAEKRQIDQTVFALVEDAPAAAAFGKDGEGFHSFCFSKDTLSSPNRQIRFLF